MRYCASGPLDTLRFGFVFLIPETLDQNCSSSVNSAIPSSFQQKNCQIPMASAPLKSCLLLWSYILDLFFTYLKKRSLLRYYSDFPLLSSSSINVAMVTVLSSVTQNSICLITDFSLDVGTFQLFFHQKHVLFV